MYQQGEPDAGDSAGTHVGKKGNRLHLLRLVKTADIMDLLQIFGLHSSMVRAASQCSGHAPVLIQCRAAPFSCIRSPALLVVYQKPHNFRLFSLFSSWHGYCGVIFKLLELNDTYKFAFK